MIADKKVSVLRTSRERNPRKYFGAFVMVLAAACTPDSIANEPLLNFEEIAAVELPDSFQATWIAVAENGNLAIGSPRWPHLLVGDNRTFTDFGAGVLKRPVAVAFDSSGNLSEVLDAGSNEIVTFSANIPVATKTFPAGWKLSHGVRVARHEWHVAGTDETGQIFVAHVSALGINRRRLVDVPSRDDALQLSITGDGGLVLVDQGHPHRLIFIRDASVPKSMVVLDSTALVAAADAGSLFDPLWRAESIIPVWQHLLYSITDLRSHRHRIHLIGQDGELLRSTEIRAPLSFAANGSQPGTLLALRNIDGQQLVTYHVTKGKTGASK